MPDTITITDDRTGQTVTVPITDGVFPSSALERARQEPLLVRPSVPVHRRVHARRSRTSTGTTAFSATAVHPIEQLAEHSTYLEVAYLLLYGDLPNESQLKTWSYEVTHHTFIHENMRKRFVDGFHYDAHPMGMFISALAALGTFYNDAKDIFDRVRAGTSRSSG